MSFEGPSCKAERLAVAAAVAPSLRVKSTRKVTTVDKDGAPVRVVTLAEVQAGVLATAKIELAVEEGVRPKEIVCACGKVVKVKQGPLPKRCSKCAKQAHHGGVCACGGVTGSPKVTRCRSCYLRASTGTGAVHTCACGKSICRDSLYCVRCAGKEKRTPVHCAKCSKILSKSASRGLCRVCISPERSRLAWATRRANAAKKKAEETT